MTLPLNLLKNSIIGLIVILSFGSLASCEKVPKKDEERPHSFLGKRALILNEGSLGNGNASISLLNLDSHTVQHNVFQAINGIEIGDILQSGLVYKDKIYLAVTNSNIVRILEKSTLKEIKTLPINGPRHIFLIKEDIAYITGYNNHKIYVVKLSTDEILSELTLPYKHVENIYVHNQTALVCNWDADNNKLYLVNTSSHNLVDSIVLGAYAPHSVLMDKHNKIWVFGGNKKLNIPSSITVLDQNTIVQTFNFDPEFEIVKPIYDTSNDEIFYISIDYLYQNPQGIYKIKSTSTTLPTEIFIPTAPYQYFYSIQINPYNKEILISDPKGFVQRGDIIRYDQNGNKLGQIEANLGPNGLLFLD